MNDEWNFVTLLLDNSDDKISLIMLSAYSVPGTVLNTLHV